MLSQFDDDETAVYFARLNAPLRRMPQADRAELHAELRQHLDALAAAHEELGASPKKPPAPRSVSLATRSKSDANFSAEWRRTARTRPHSLWAAIGHMTLWKLVMLAISVASGFSLNGSGNEVNGWRPIFWGYLLFFISPLLAGIITGLKMPKKAAPSALYSGLPFVLPFLLLMLFSGGDNLLGLTVAFDWLAVSFVGAYAASAHRRGGFYRLSWADFKLRADFKFRDGKSKSCTE